MRQRGHLILQSRRYMRDEKFTHEHDDCFIHYCLWKNL